MSTFFQIIKYIKEDNRMVCNMMTFKELKKTLIHFPTLQVPKKGVNLTMYVAFVDTNVSIVLVTRKDQQKQIFFYSKALQGAKIRYEVKKN